MEARRAFFAFPPVKHFAEFSPSKQKLKRQRALLPYAKEGISMSLYRDSAARGPANTASGETQTCLDCGPNQVRGFTSASRQPRGTAA